MEAEFQRRGRVEVAEDGCDAGNYEELPVKVAGDEDDQAAEDGQAEENGDGSFQLLHSGRAVLQVGIFVGESLFALFPKSEAVFQQFVLIVEIVVKQVAAQVHKADAKHCQKS